ncbi:SAM pointed domain-containing Ets transcription factor isoform X1 [Patagioenas fasciata]|uniref:SAM pointed domain-containing Ets transcription factor isoform X1 n=1 Tax=Patagioenas fasciata TaxID=372321 RepID=UPI003A997169
MGSTGPGLTALPPGRAPRPEPALLPPPRDPDTRSWGCPDSPSPPGTPEQPVPAFCLHYFDMLYTEDSAWATKGAGDPSPGGAPGGRGEAPKEPEQCPIIDSQGPALGAGGALPGSLALEEHSLEQVQSLVLGEVLKDIETACKLLNIPADPADWSPGNVQKWILWTEHQYRLPQIGKSFQELSGKDLCAMSEEQFCQRSPACGDILHAHLDIWKSAVWMKEKAAPEDVKYSGEFHTGSAPLTSRLPQAGLGDSRGHYSLNCNYLVRWSSCCSSSRVVAAPSALGSPWAVCEMQPKGNGCETLTVPIPHPTHPCGAVQGQDRAVFPAPRQRGGNDAPSPSAQADPQRPAGIQAGFPRPGLVWVSGVSLPTSHLLFPGRR